MMAEWEHQSRVLFSFPRRNGDWGAQLETASQELTHLILTTAQFVAVAVVCGDLEWAERYLSESKIELISIPTNDCWIRDFGPISQRVDLDILLHDFRFNGWGQKFEAEADNRV
ncbi:MAG: agmatine deiminase family protein, partial [Bacteroidota bacterium]